MKGITSRILKWTALGLLIRVLVMPFTMHGQDSLFINYFPMLFVTNGIWDAYGFINGNFPNFPYTYYGPMVFIIMSVANFIIIKVFNPVYLVEMLKLASPMFFQHFTASDYAQVFLQHFPRQELFKNLFLVKAPYLVFDFLIAGILLKLARTSEKALASYKLWMLNLVVIYSAYAVGGFDVIPAFFIIAAVYAAIRKRPFLCVILLSFGGATKLFPFVFILPTCLLLGENWKDRIKLILTAVLAAVIPYIPFYLSSGGAVFRTFMLVVMRYSGVAHWIMMGLFAGVYVVICVNAFNDSKNRAPESKVLFYYLAIGLVFYAAIPISFRYFVFVTPLLALLMPYNKKFAVFTLTLIIMLAFLRLPYRTLQAGLLAPVNPGYFTGLPTAQEIIGRFANIEFIYKVLARALALCFLIAAWWSWRIGQKVEETYT